MKLKIQISTVYIFWGLFLFTQTFEAFSQKSESVVSTKYVKNYNIAKTAFDNGDLQTAKFYLDACLESRPHDMEALLLRGICRQQTGQINSAIRDYSMLISINPNHAEALYSRGILFYKNLQYEPAQNDFIKLLELPQTETQAVFYKTGVKEKGVSQIATMNTMQADIYNYLGLCSYHMNKLQDAIEHFTEAISHFTDNADFYINRGLTFETSGQTIRAISDFKLALDIQPGNEIAKFNLARLQSGESEEEETIATYTDIIESNPDFAEAYFNRALAYYNLMQYQSALEDYNMALKLDSSLVDTWFNRALVKQQLEDMGGALSDLDHATDLQPNFEKAWHGKGVVLTKIKQYENAVSMFDLAIYYNPDFALAYYNRGIAKLNLKQNKEACKDLKEALKLGLKTANKLINKKCN